MSPEWGWGYGHMMFGPFMWIFWIVLIVLVLFLVRFLMSGERPGAGQGPEPKTKTPLELLEERYARGEIDDAEFERRRRALRGE